MRCCASPAGSSWRSIKLGVSQPIYIDPPAWLPSLDDCRFYHVMDLPGLGVQPGSWDLRGRYDEYFGGHNFSGQRVLDLGTASGALAFEIERRGAREVIGFDLDDRLVYDCRLPIVDTALAQFRQTIVEIKNGFWLAHRLLRSNVKVVYGHLGGLPDMGRFDAIMMGNVLQHLQDPIGAVLQAIRLTDHLIITEADWLENTGDDLPCMIMYDLPHPFSWYQVKAKLLQMFLNRRGYSEQSLTWHTHDLLLKTNFADDGRFVQQPARVPARHYTLSARRPR
jgi:SAM-dependent methyltransferase